VTLFGTKPGTKKCHQKYVTALIRNGLTHRQTHTADSSLSKIQYRSSNHAKSTRPWSRNALSLSPEETANFITGHVDSLHADLKAGSLCNSYSCCNVSATESCGLALADAIVSRAMTTVFDRISFFICDAVLWPALQTRLMLMYVIALLVGYVHSGQGSDQ
jgi:hypothetical protein